MAADVIVVIPSENELAVEEFISCPFQSCQKSFKSSASLKMHVTRHHEGKSLSASNKTSKTKKLYYCPINGCNRSQEGKPFPRLGQLKQHYNTVHKANSFSCSKCGRGFGLRDALGRHEKECGQIFKCSKCDMEFKSSNALYQHNKRSHDITRKAPPPTTPLLLPPIVIKPVIQISKNVPKLDSVCQTPERSEPELANLTGLDLAIQTDLSCLATDQQYLYDPTDLFNGSTGIHESIQTISVSSCEFGTQTMSFSDSWCQEALPHPPPQAESHDLALADILDSSCIDFGTQTLETCSLDFGPHTLLTEDKGSQT